MGSICNLLFICIKDGKGHATRRSASVTKQNLGSVECVPLLSSWVYKETWARCFRKESWVPLDSAQEIILRQNDSCGTS